MSENNHSQSSKTATQVPQERHDLRILQALRRIIRSVDIHSRKLAVSHNITTPQLISLLAIVEHGPMTVAAIGKEIHLSPSTMVGILDRLENKQLIVRKRSVTDRRQVLVEATEQGYQFISQAPSPLQDKLSTALSDISKKEQCVLAESLERIVELMEFEAVDASPILETGPISKS